MSERFESDVAFRGAVLQAWTQALEARSRALVLCDPSFVDWPLGDAAGLQTLSAFVRLPGRRLVLIARSYESLRRRFPRFVAWRTTWSHAITALEPVDEGVELPCALLADRALALHVVSTDPWEGGWVTDRGRLQSLAEQIDALQRRSQTSFPAQTTGL